MTYRINHLIPDEKFVSEACIEVLYQFILLRSGTYDESNLHVRLSYRFAETTNFFVLDSEVQSVICSCITPRVCMYAQRCTAVSDVLLIAERTPL